MKKIITPLFLLMLAPSLVASAANNSSAFIKETKESLEMGVEIGMDVRTNFEIPDCVTVTYNGLTLDTSDGWVHLDEKGIYIFTFTDGSVYRIEVGDGDEGDSEDIEYPTDEELAELDRLEREEQGKDDDEDEENTEASKKSNTTSTTEKSKITTISIDNNKKTEKPVDITSTAKTYVVDNEKYSTISKIVKVSKVKKVKVKNKSKGKIYCTWDSTKNAQYYQLQFSTSKGMKKNTKSFMIPGTKFTIPGLKKNKTYYIRVRGLSKESNIKGSWSKIVKIKLKK